MEPISRFGYNRFISMKNHSPRSIAVRVWALTLLFVLALPNSVWALRPAGMEESNSVVKNDFLAAAGMEESGSMDWRASTPSYAQRIASIRLLSKPKETARNLDRFRRLYGPRWKGFPLVPLFRREGHIPLTSQWGDSARLAAWAKENGFNQETYNEFTAFFRDNIQPHHPEWVIALNKLPSIAAWNNAHPEAPIHFLGYEAYKSEAGSFKIYQYVWELLHKVAYLNHPGEPNFDGVQMFSTGNGIRAAATVIEKFRRLGILPADFKIEMIAQRAYLKEIKLKHLRPFEESGVLGYVEPSVIKEEFEQALKSDPGLARRLGVPVDKLGKIEKTFDDDINGLLRLIEWSVLRHHKYQIKASDSLSAVQGSAVMYRDIWEAYDQSRQRLSEKLGVDSVGDYIDAILMSSAGGTPGGGLAMGAWLFGHPTQIVGTMASARPASLGEALNIQNVQEYARTLLGLQGWRRHQQSEASEWALVMAASEMREAGLPIEITSAITYANLLEQMVLHPERIQQAVRRKSGRPLTILAVLTGQNVSQEDVDWVIQKRDQFGLRSLDYLRGAFTGLEEGTAVASVSDARFRVRRTINELLIQRDAATNRTPQVAVIAPSYYQDQLPSLRQWVQQMLPAGLRKQIFFDSQDSGERSSWITGLISNPGDLPTAVFFGTEGEFNEFSFFMGPTPVGIRHFRTNITNASYLFVELLRNLGLPVNSLGSEQRLQLERDLRLIIQA